MLHLKIVIGNILGTFSKSGAGYTEDANYPSYYIPLSNLTNANEISGLKVKATIIDDDGNVTEVTFNPQITNIEEQTIKEGDKSIFDSIYNIISNGLSGVIEEVSRLLERTLNDLLLPIGDGIVFMVSKSVGEAVTIDRLVFDKVEKVSIDYWNVNKGDSSSVKSIMAKVITPWYNFFNKIAIIVFMLVLVIVGIEVMLKSTAEKKAKYKDVLVSWVVGVIILMFFPYAMKYIVRINNATVLTLDAYMTSKSDVEPSSMPQRPPIIEQSFLDASELFGNDEFVEQMTGVEFGDTVKLDQIPDAMMQTRLFAQKLKKIVLTVIYFILIGETLALLILYYKRAFMVAFLITIFPLVAMTYVVDKIGDKRAQSLEIWTKEYIVNVVVQLFHAITYLVIIGVGFQSYVKTGGTQWLFMIISILFLFQGERILRNIFGIKSSANTIGDLATSGLALYGVIRAGSRIFGNKSNDVSGAQDRQDAAGLESRQKAREKNNIGYQQSSGAVAASASGSANGGSDGNSSSAGAVSSAPMYDGSLARDTVLQNSISRRLTGGLATRGVNFVGSTVGATLGATMQLAKGGELKTMTENVVTGIQTGKELGKTFVKPVAGIANKAEQIVHGKKIERQIASGEMDEKLGLNGEMPIPANLASQIDENEIVGKNGETAQEIYRKALAEYAKISARKGKSSGERAYFKFLEDNIKKS